MKTEYPSRVDSWLAVILIGAPLAVVATGAFAMTKSVGAGIVAIITGLVVGGVIAAFSIPCVYTLSDDSLNIKSRQPEGVKPDLYKSEGVVSAVTGATAMHH